MKNNTIRIKCDDNTFPNLEMYLFSLEFNDKPFLDSLAIETNTDIYHYKIKKENNVYYIVTD